MNSSAVFTVCLIISLSNYVDSFEFIREILFPRRPEVQRFRRIEVARALGDQFAVLDTVGLIEQYGYPAEEHKVTTDDGYNLIFFRIPNSPKSPPMKMKPMVFLQHGIVGSSDHWVLLGPNRDLAFLLADAGYDVWIGNTRGNTYSRSHTNLSPLEKEFWDFSFHEIATLDLPKMMDYALETSGQETLFYIGHSMGTTMSYILLSEIPEYNDRMRLVVSLAPIAFWKEPPNNPAVRLAIDSTLVLKRILEEARVYDIAPQTKNNIRLGRAFCNDDTIAQNACKSLYFISIGTDNEQLNSTLLPYFFSYYPAGASTKTFYHFQQTVKSGFRQYDLGEVENMLAYGKKKPPIYNLKKISAPFALIYAKNDVLSRESNVEELGNKLQNVVTTEAVPFDLFNHMDFLWAIDGKDLLYNRVIELLSMHEKYDLETKLSKISVNTL